MKNKTKKIIEFVLKVTGLNLAFIFLSFVFVFMVYAATDIFSLSSQLRTALLFILLAGVLAIYIPAYLGLIKENKT